MKVGDAPDIQVSTGRASQASSATPDSRWLLRITRATGAWVLRGGRVVAGSSLEGFLAGTFASPHTLDRALAAFSHQGESALSDLRGQFVLAVTNRRTREGWIARDPLGAHPLFFTVVPDAVLVAAHINTLLAEPSVSRSLNRAAIADHLCKRWPDKGETFFESVRRVPPGWLLHIGAHGVTTRRYWNPGDDQIDWLPDEEVDRFDALLDQAVGRGLTGRSAVFLSGGFDSVSVAAASVDLTRRRGTPPPIALSLGFPDPICDEQHVQRSVATQLGMPLGLVPFDEAAGPRGLLQAGLDLNAGLPAPLFNSWMPAYLTLVQRGRAAGVDTILTGEGGDEWLGTSPYVTADLLRRGDLAGALRVARTWKRSYRQGWFTVARGTLWQFGLRPLAGMACARVAPTAWDRSRARRAIRATPDWIAADPALRKIQFDRAHGALAVAIPAGGFYSRESRALLDETLNSWLFEEQFEFGQRYGVRYVHPYWDPDLVAHVYRVRPERLNADDRTKALVRQTVARRFPALGFERQRKVPALGFFASLVRTQGPPLGEAVSDFRGLAALGVVVPDRCRAFMRRAWEGSPSELGVAWNVVNMEAWVRSHLA